MLQAVENGWQAALMAPTEILAEQHYASSPPGWRRSASRWPGCPAAERSASARPNCRAGERRVLLAVGTHALIEDPGVDLPGSALAVVDEQHRFGVRQRLALREKGEGGQSPAQLMMSATPIPRTLAMSYYADLDVSVLDELPPGRTPIRTRLVPTRAATRWSRVRAPAWSGRQAYWVCPLIEESEALQLQTAQDTYEHAGRGAARAARRAGARPL
jgi:ATP-dependent DNA helicase RecG